MPTTTNFGWTTPADTDLVKDGASAMRTLAGGIDTSMAQLKGGTTGQILSKTSGTDMAFTWINNDQGDITGVTAGTGLTGGGTSGSVTVSLDSPVAATLGGTAQTTYTTGDLLYASGTNTLAKRAIGTTGQVLAVSGGVPAWTTLASGSGMTYLNILTGSGSNQYSLDNVFTSTYQNYMIIGYVDSTSGSGDLNIRLRGGGSTVSTSYNSRRIKADAANGVYTEAGSTSYAAQIAQISASPTDRVGFVIYMLNPQASKRTKTFAESDAVDSSNDVRWQNSLGYHDSTNSYDGFNISFGTNFDVTARVYGIANS